MEQNENVVENVKNIKTTKVKKPCRFQQKWLLEFPWVAEHSSPLVAICVYCEKDIKIDRMGVTALRAHERTDGHPKYAPAWVKETDIPHTTVSMADLRRAFSKREPSIDPKVEDESKSPKKVYHFQEKWMEEFPWVKEHKVSTLATCIYCNKTLRIGMKGITQLRFHEKCESHVKVAPKSLSQVIAESKLSMENLRRAFSNRDPSKRKIKLSSNPINFPEDDPNDEDYIATNSNIDDDEEFEENMDLDDLSDASEDSDDLSETVEPLAEMSRKDATMTSVEEILNAMNYTPTLTESSSLDSEGKQTSESHRKKYLVCGVCLESESNDQDEILECDLCGITVHEGCYGVMGDETNINDDSFTEGPLEPWFCEPCKACLEEKPACELCPNVGGIYKHTDNGKWVHLVCAIYTPNVGFRDIPKLQTVILGGLKAHQWGTKECVLCEDEALSCTGVCVMCDAGMCKTTFHVTCALKNGFLSEIPDHSASVRIEEAELLYAHCKLHSKKEDVKRRKQSWMIYSSHVSSFRPTEVPEEKAQIDEALELTKRKYQKFRANIKLPKQQAEPFPRLLSSCPEACICLARKAEILGFASASEFNVNGAIVKGSISKFAPNLTTGFVNHFYKREFDIQQIRAMLPNVEPTLRRMLDEQHRLTKHCEKYREKLGRLNKQNRKLAAEFKRYQDIVEKITGHQLIQKPENDLEKNAMASTDLLNSAVNKCSVCDSTDNQHELVQCDQCQKYYHFKCVDPPLERLPKKTKNYSWRCTECDDTAPSQEISGEVETKRVSKKTEVYSDHVAESQPVKIVKQLATEIKSEGDKNADDASSKKASRKRPLETKAVSSPKSVSQPKKQKVSKTVPTAKDLKVITKKIDSPKVDIPAQSIKVEENSQKRQSRRSASKDIIQIDVKQLTKQNTNGKKTLTCCVCNVSGNPKTLVVCDGCEQAHHFATCLQPPMPKCPKRLGWSWFCSDCELPEGVDEAVAWRPEKFFKEEDEDPKEVTPVIVLKPTGQTRKSTRSSNGITVADSNKESAVTAKNDSEEIERIIDQDTLEVLTPSKSVLSSKANEVSVSEVTSTTDENGMAINVLRPTVESFDMTASGNGTQENISGSTESRKNDSVEKATNEEISTKKVLSPNKNDKNVLNSPNKITEDDIVNIFETFSGVPDLEE